MLVLLMHLIFFLKTPRSETERLKFIDDFFLNRDMHFNKKDTKVLLMF